MPTPEQNVLFPAIRNNLGTWNFCGPANRIAEGLTLQASLPWIPPSGCTLCRYQGTSFVTSHTLVLQVVSRSFTVRCLGTIALHHTYMKSRLSVLPNSSPIISVLTVDKDNINQSHEFKHYLKLISASSAPNVMSDQANIAFQTAEELVDGLKRIDGMLSQPDHVRSVEAQAIIGNMVVVPHSRILYRPQPAISKTAAHPNLAALHDGFDWSMMWLCKDIRHTKCIDDSAAVYESSTAYGDGVHYLTYMDAYAALPPGARTEGMIIRVAHVKALLQKLRTQKNSPWHEEVDSLPSFPDNAKRLDQCTIYSTLQRLIFYNGRAQGDNAFDIEASVWRLRKELKIPEDWCFVTELELLEEWAKEFLEEMHRLEARFNEAAELEWDGEPVTLNEVSTVVPVGEWSEHNCIVCRYSLTPPAVRTKCNHIYCSECLLTWIHTFEKMSHTCPLCRTELFTPKYKVKESSATKNHQDAYVKAFTNFNHIADVILSASWFAKEMSLHKLWCQETGQGSILLTK
jgi:hypothetical protein